MPPSLVDTAEGNRLAKLLIMAPVRQPEAKTTGEVPSLNFCVSS